VVTVPPRDQPEDSPTAGASAPLAIPLRRNHHQPHHQPYSLYGTAPPPPASPLAQRHRQETAPLSVQEREEVAKELQAQESRLAALYGVRGERFPGTFAEAEEEEDEVDYFEVDHHNVLAEALHDSTGQPPEEAERGQPALFGQQGTAVDLAPEAQSGTPRRRQEEQVEQPPR